MRAVRAARAAGTAAFFTVDAGPQVKVFTEPGTTLDLAGIDGVERVIEVGVGPGAHLV
jgi:mevalonate pyrophosphate decarboxylase